MPTEKSWMMQLTTQRQKTSTKHPVRERSKTKPQKKLYRTRKKTERLAKTVDWVNEQAKMESLITELTTFTQSLTNIRANRHPKELPRAN